MLSTKLSVAQQVAWRDCTDLVKSSCSKTSVYVGDVRFGAVSSKATLLRCRTIAMLYRSVARGESEGRYGSMVRYLESRSIGPVMGRMPLSLSRQTFSHTVLGNFLRQQRKRVVVQDPKGEYTTRVYRARGYAPTRWTRTPELPVDCWRIKYRRRPPNDHPRSPKMWLRYFTMGRVARTP